MVNRGRDFFPKIEHVAIGRKPGGGLTMFARTLLLLNGRNGSAGIAASARAFESSPLKDRDEALRELATAARWVDRSAFGKEEGFAQAHQALLKALEKAGDFV